MSNEKSAPATSSAQYWENRVVENAAQAMQSHGRALSAQQAAALYGIGREIDQIHGQMQRAQQFLSGPAIKPPPEEDWKAASEMWRQRFNAADRRAEDAMRQLQMLEADAKTVNTDFDRALCEHKEEISFLRRELKRLDPRLWKARYGRG